MKSGTSFLLGMICGLTAGMLIKKIRIISEEEHPDALADKISNSLRELEKRAHNLESKFSS